MIEVVGVKAVLLPQAEHRSLMTRPRTTWRCRPRPKAALVLRREAVGVNDSRAALAFANIAAEPEGLAKGQPALARKAV